MNFSKTAAVTFLRSFDVHVVAGILWLLPLMLLQLLKSQLKGTVSRDFCFWFFFHESVSPQPQSIPLRPFKIFSKIPGDIRESRCTTGINDTKSNLPPVSMTPVANCHRYQRRRRQIMTTISGCRHLKVNLKAKTYI
jgi:hypothetical protein